MTATLTRLRRPPASTPAGKLASPATTGLSDGQRELLAKVPDEVDHVTHESFELPETEQRLFGPDAPTVEVPLWMPAGLATSGTTVARRASLTSEQEILLFLRYNYARFRLGKLLAKPRAKSHPKSVREVLAWHARAMSVRSSLVRATLALVYAMAKRAHISNVEFTELISEGNMALLRSVEKFDVTRGAKFSTYACRSILKSFSRLAKRIQRQRKNLPMHASPNLDYYDGHVAKHETRWMESLETLREILCKNLASLSEVEKIIVTERFALETGGKGRTLSQVADIVGLTNERVRQLQVLALRKIRAALERHLLSPVLGGVSQGPLPQPVRPRVRRKSKSN